MEKSFECEWESFINIIGEPSGAMKAFSQSPLPLAAGKSKQSSKLPIKAPLEIACHNGMMAVIDCTSFNIERRHLFGSLGTSSVPRPHD